MSIDDIAKGLTVSLSERGIPYVKPFEVDPRMVSTRTILVIADWGTDDPAKSCGCYVCERDGKLLIQVVWRNEVESFTSADEALNHVEELTKR